MTLLDKLQHNSIFLQARIARELIELRNKSVFAFLMFNSLFVLVVFLLQLNKDQIHVKWPLGIRTNVTFIEETAEVFTGLRVFKAYLDTNVHLWNWDSYVVIHIFTLILLFYLVINYSQIQCWSTLFQ